jgi:hypothetical protein
MKHFLVLTLAAIGTCGFAQTLKSVAVPNPAPAGSIQPNWTVAADGSVLLSWVEPSKDTYALRYAVRHGSAFGESRTIAAGRNFWRHPAEIPGLLSMSDGTLLAHWVEKGKGKDSSDAEDLYVSSSKDGIHWTAPAMAHHDHAAVQHGLASIVQSGPHEASVLWLWANKGDDGPVTLMRTIVDADGKELKEEPLDTDVCGCCPTSVVKTAKGILVAYRDHTSKDIRDIAILRFENGKWSTSKVLYADNWEVNACPVNAASASAKDNRLAIAWYTEGGDKPKVELVFSSDGGTTFTKPLVMNTGDTLGYASAALTADGGAVVSWIEEGEKSARVMTRAVSAAGVAGPVMQVAEGSRTKLGYPRVVHSGSDTFIAWGDAQTGIKTAELK